MKTQTELVTKALGLLGVIQAGQDPAAEDVATVQSFITGKFTELARRQILYVADPNQIDDEYFLPLAKIIANAAAPEFGQPFSAEADQREELRLRDINRGSASYPIQRTDFF